MLRLMHSHRQTEFDSTWAIKHTFTLNCQKKEVMSGVVVRGLVLKVKHERALHRHTP